MILKNYKKSLTTSIALRFFSVINGLVPLILFQQVTNQVNKFAILLHKYRFNKDCRNRLCVMSGNDECWGRCFGTFSQSGRSMIEMLGVLAIIAVLSVGGIAGYSKAMEKYRINKLSQEYSDFIFSLIQYAPNFQKESTQGLFDISHNLGIMPRTWGGDRIYIRDSFKNRFVARWYKDSHFQFEIIMDNNPQKLCPALFQSLIIPLHNVLQNSRLISMSHASEYYYGDKICGKKIKKCIRDLSPATIAEMCRECSKYERCNLVFNINPWL